MMKKHETMTKKAVSILLLIVALTTVGCKKDDTPSTVSVSGVTVSPTALRLKVGETTVIKATVLPADATNKEVSWLSSDPAIATVSPTGEVRGIAPGKVTVTAITKDGAKMAGCDVRIKSIVTEEFAALVQKVTTAETVLSTLRQEFDDLKKSTQGAKDKAQALKALIDKISEHRNSLTALLDEVKAETDDLHPEEVTTLTEKISALTGDITTLMNDVEAYKTKIDKMIKAGKGNISDVEIIKL